MPNSHAKETPAMNGKKNGAVATPNHRRETSWTCKKCTLINPVGKNICSACSCSQLYSKKNMESQGSGQSPKKKDTWSCPQCTLLNSHSALKCKACKTSVTPRTETKVFWVTIQIYHYLWMALTFAFDTTIHYLFLICIHRVPIRLTGCQRSWRNTHG